MLIEAIMHVAELGDEAKEAEKKDVRPKRVFTQASSPNARDFFIIPSSSSKAILLSSNASTEPYLRILVYPIRAQYSRIKPNEALAISLHAISPSQSMHYV